MLTGIILASGFSRRFNGDKLTYMVKGKSIVAHVVENCLNSRLDEIIVIYRNDEVYELLMNYNIKIFRNENAQEGMAAGMRLGVENASYNSEGYMIFMGDQILFLSSDIDKMIDVFEKQGKISAASYDGKRRNPVIFPSSYRDKILSIHGDEGGRSILKNEEDDIVLVEFENIKSFDIDRTVDVNTILKYLEKSEK